MVVDRGRISVSRLSCFGSRCCTRTNATPGSAGTWVSNDANASSPPAEAPMPTIGKESDRSAASAARRWGVGKCLSRQLSISDVDLDDASLEPVVSLGTAVEDGAWMNRSSPALHREEHGCVPRHEETARIAAWIRDAAADASGGSD